MRVLGLVAALPPFSLCQFDFPPSRRRRRFTAFLFAL